MVCAKYVLYPDTKDIIQNHLMLKHPKPAAVWHPLAYWSREKWACPVYVGGLPTSIGILVISLGSSWGVEGLPAQRMPSIRRINGPHSAGRLLFVARVRICRSARAARCCVNRSSMPSGQVMWNIRSGQVRSGQAACEVCEVYRLHSVPVPV